MNRIENGELFLDKASGLNFQKQPEDKPDYSIYDEIGKVHPDDQLPIKAEIESDVPPEPEDPFEQEIVEGDGSTESEPDVDAGWQWINDH